MTDFANIFASLGWYTTKSDGSPRVAVDVDALTVIDSLTLGIGTNCSCVSISKRLTILSGATESILINANIMDALGQINSLGSVKALMISVLTEDSGTQLKVGGVSGSMSTFFADSSDAFLLGSPGSVLLFAPIKKGYLVDGSLKLTAIGGNVLVDVALIGDPTDEFLPQSTWVWGDGSTHVWSDGSDALFN